MDHCAFAELYDLCDSAGLELRLGIRQGATYLAIVDENGDHIAMWSRE